MFIRVNKVELTFESIFLQMSQVNNPTLLQRKYMSNADIFFAPKKL